ncbi:alkaline phosphatase D family protein [Methylophilus aquaticus]|uniref:Alkaline phosphatase D family protein n=1 Tax=Methylophilus aquaticus TaxID=1971610 RepID=A0ABT9JUL3_9PROT|nr:alkaline phosphatase D family protein [Methylophilus aquaticus]MDP8568288.1 alkaline phosphatase D family protein [Methylophilus aquaticus]
MSSANIALGPLLGLEGEAAGNTCYSICFLSEDKVASALLECSMSGHTQQVPFKLLSQLNRGKFWRAEIILPPSTHDQTCTYRILIDQQTASYIADRTHNISSWTFFYPASNSQIQLAFASCNGFSSDKVRAQHPAPTDFMWQRMWQEHHKRMEELPYSEVMNAPYAALLLGGDQIYADSIFNLKQPLYAWSKKPLAAQKAATVSNTLKQKIDTFYLETYLRSWTESTPLRACLASIPNVMMWDDHDIVDGWGSQPCQLESCPTYQALFQSAQKYFTLFQLRGLSNRALQEATPSPAHFGMTLRFRDYALLVMDNRSQRSLINIMGSGKQAFVQALATLATDWKSGQKMLVLSGVPFLYRHFSESDTNIKLSIQFDAYDDMADHWRFSTHYDEMCSILHHLLAFQTRLQPTTPVSIFIISGDVHVAGSGTFREKFGTGSITQLISSGIVHPPPVNAEQSIIRLASSVHQPDIDLGGGKVLAATVRTDAAQNTFLFHRNYACMHESSDRKVWVNWHYETITFANPNALTERTPAWAPPKLGYQVLSLPY